MLTVISAQTGVNAKIFVHLIHVYNVNVYLIHSGMACLWDIPNRAPSPMQEVSIESYESSMETELRNLKAMSESFKSI